MICKNARVKILMQRWETVAKEQSWQTATAIKSIFYYMALSNKAEKDELNKRKKEMQMKKELALSMERPKLNMKLFRVGKPPREAQHQLRVYRNTLPQDKIDLLEKKISDYQDRAAMAQLAKNFNSSLNRVGRLTDTLARMGKYILYIQDIIIDS